MTRSHMRQLGVEDGSKVWLSISKGAITVPIHGGVPSPA